MERGKALLHDTGCASSEKFKNNHLAEMFRGGLVFKAHRLVYHSNQGWRVMKKKKRGTSEREREKA